MKFFFIPVTAQCIKVMQSENKEPEEEEKILSKTCNVVSY